MATQVVNVAFAATNTGTATWTAMAGNYGIIQGVQVSDGSGPVCIDLTSVSSSGATINASAPFTGTVSLTVFDA